MTNPRSLTLLAAAAAMLVAPAAEAKRPRADEPERGVYSLNQPVVERSDYVLDLTAHDEGLSRTERARLGAWFDSLGLGYGDRVFVEEGYGPGPGRRDVARLAADYGILLSEGAPITAGQVRPGSVRVVVSRSIAYVPDCPNSRSTGPSSVSANYGCAVNSNLAAMIADPADLVLGQAGSVGDGGVAGNKAIKVYREAAPTGTKGLQSISTKGGQ